MTNEEAIRLIDDMRRNAIGLMLEKKQIDALDMAIEALSCSESPNSSDTISRQSAIDAVKKHYRTHDNDLLELIAFDIERLPHSQNRGEVTVYANR